MARIVDQYANHPQVISETEALFKAKFGEDVDEVQW